MFNTISLLKRHFWLVFPGIKFRIVFFKQSTIGTMVVLSCHIVFQYVGLRMRQLFNLHSRNISICRYCHVNKEASYFWVFHNHAGRLCLNVSAFYVLTIFRQMGGQCLHIFQWRNCPILPCLFLYSLGVRREQLNTK